VFSAEEAAELWEQPETRHAQLTRDVAELYRILNRRGVSQRVIAYLTGQSQSEISEILGGRRVVAYEVLERVCLGLMIPPGHMGLAYDADTSQLLGPMSPQWKGDQPPKAAPTAKPPGELPLNFDRSKGSQLSNGDGTSGERVHDQALTDAGRPTHVVHIPIHAKSLDDAFVIGELLVRASGQSRSIRADLTTITAASKPMSLWCGLALAGGVRCSLRANHPGEHRAVVQPQSEKV
jgi:transcriptional regulator with XRE-family HTH domain